MNVRKIGSRAALLLLAAVTVLMSLLFAQSSQASTNPPSRTHVHTVRPVTASGAPVRGYSVHLGRDVPGFRCWRASSYAVSPNIRQCGTGAGSAASCWKSSNHTVLCLRDPQVRRLVRMTYRGSFGAVNPTAHPDPQSLVLENREHCVANLSGASPVVYGHPRWSDWYDCDHSAVYGPNSNHGIMRTQPLWGVREVMHAGTARQSITTRPVTSAYFVGTAR
jgi:hypothetical protein